MEAELVAIAAGIGTFVSVFMVIDSARDVRLVQRKRRTELMPFAQHRLINEIIRLIIQLMFLVSGVIYSLDRFEFFRDVAFLLLISVPIVLAGWSIYSFFRRRHWLRDDDSQRRRHDDL